MASSNDIRATFLEYFARNGGQPYCQFVVAPKLAKFRQKFAQRRKR